MLQNNYHWPAPVNTMQRQYKLAASHKSPGDFHIHGACSSCEGASKKHGRHCSLHRRPGSYGSPADGSTLPQSPTITAAREGGKRQSAQGFPGIIVTSEPLSAGSSNPLLFPCCHPCCAAVNATGHLCCLPADVMCSVPAAAQA